MLITNLNISLTFAFILANVVLMLREYHWLHKYCERPVPFILQYLWKISLYCILQIIGLYFSWCFWV